MSIIKSIPLYVFSFKKKEKENSSPMKFLKKNVKKKNVEILEENGLLLLIFKLCSNLSLFLNYLSVSPCFKT